MTGRCSKGHRLTWNSRKGHYCWPCENRARVAACSHQYTDSEVRGILGRRFFCCHCGDMYVGPMSERGEPLVEAAEA